MNLHKTECYDLVLSYDGHDLMDAFQNDNELIVLKWTYDGRGGPGKRSQRGCYDVVGFGGGVANQQTVKKKRRIHSAAFKARVALEALKGIKTISQIAQDEGVHPVQVSTWKKELQERLPEVFGSKSDAKAEAAQAERAKARLERKVGQLVIEKDFLKKKCVELGIDLNEKP